MKFPDFIVAGCMKAGTTSMFMNLSKHPDITMSGVWGPLDSRRNTGTGTEINYWDSRKKKHDLNWYKSRFLGNVCGEKSPGYWVHLGALRMIHKYNPNTKLILSFRHPVERAYSHYWMNSVKANSLIPFSPEVAKSIHVNLGKYYSNLNNFVFKFFSRENVYISISDWMKKNPSEEMMKIHKFLGVVEMDLPAREIIWGKRKNSLYKISKEKSYIIWSTKTKPKITRKVRKHYLKFYESHNEKLFEFLGYRIPEWES